MSDVTELWRLIVSQADDKIHNIGTVKGKPNMIPRWPPESIRLAKECERLTQELEQAQEQSYRWELKAREMASQAGWENSDYLTNDEATE